MKKLSEHDRKIIEEAKEELKSLKFVETLAPLDKANFMALTKMTDKVLEKLALSADDSGDRHKMDLIYHAIRIKKLRKEANA